MTYPIFALEGISYAGKTSLSLKLKEEGFLRINELSELQKNGQNFPKFPKSDLEALSSDKWFLEQEILRSQYARELSRYGPIIMDRSWLSSSAFTYARFKVYNIGNHNIHTKMIHDTIETGQLIVPINIYLKINLDTYKERRKSNLPERITKFGEDVIRHVSVPDNHSKFAQTQIEFYDKYFLNNKDNNSLILDGSNSLDTLTEQIIAFTNFKQ